MEKKGFVDLLTGRLSLKLNNGPCSRLGEDLACLAYRRHYSRARCSQYRAGLATDACTLTRIAKYGQTGVVRRMGLGSDMSPGAVAASRGVVISGCLFTTCEVGQKDCVDGLGGRTGCVRR